MSDLLFKKVISTQRARRENLINKMCSLDTNNINCSSCRGKCCTLMANSMRITPVETIDMHHYLLKNKLWNDELKKKLKKCIDDFRLEDNIDFGRGRSLRKTYTCPFYMNEFPGCPFPTSVKPYGCLAFNPVRGKPTDGEACKSDLNMLEEREGLVAQERTLNQDIGDELSIRWDKLPIPLALLKLNEIIENKI